MTAPEPTPPPEPLDDQDPLVKGVRLRGERQQRWMREGDPSVSRRLAQIGVLGWIIVVPLLIGVFAGHWLDQKFNSKPHARAEMGGKSDRRGPGRQCTEQGRSHALCIHFHADQHPSASPSISNGAVQNSPELNF